MLASHLIATAAAQEPGQLRWQNLRTGRARCQRADLFGTGQSAALGSPGYGDQPAVYLYIAPLEVNVLNCRVQNGRGWMCVVVAAGSVGGPAAVDGQDNAGEVTSSAAGWSPAGTTRSPPRSSAG